MKNTKKSILLRAYEIVDKRSEEKSRQYGSFSEGMKRAATIASVMSGREIRPHDVFSCLIGLKLSRESFNHKEDNLVDAVAYLGALNNFINEELKKQKRERPKRKGRRAHK